jgi:anti-sigma factor RsiW
MAANDLTCDEVDAQSLDTRYLSGALSASEAEAFEQHYFGCDRCWKLVEQGMELRAALGAPAARAAPIIALPESRTMKRRATALNLLLAAGAVFVAFGIYNATSGRRRSSDDTERGAQRVLAISASHPSPDSIVAAWPRVEGALRYRSRVFTSTCTLVAEAESPDTFAVQLTNALTKRGAVTSISSKDTSRLFWNVEALDAHGAVIAKSPLTPVGRAR